MLLPAQIENNFREFGDKLFTYPFSKYLKDTGRTLFGLIVDEEAGKFEKLFGPVTAHDLELFNAHFHANLSGYKVDAKSFFKELSAEADVFLLSKIYQLPDFNPSHVDGLIIHELCHWYIEADLLKAHPMVPSLPDRVLAKNIYQQTPRELESETQHSLEFCELVCAVSSRAAKAFPRFKDSKEVVTLAMQYSIMNDAA